MGVRKLLLQHGADPTLKDNPRNDFPMKGFDKNQSHGVIEYRDHGVMKYGHISSDGVERDVGSDDLVARDSIKSDMINLQKGNLDLPVEENEPSF